MPTPDPNYFYRHFGIGDNVSFTTTEGEKIEGIVVRSLPNKVTLFCIGTGHVSFDPRELKMPTEAMQ